MSKFEFRFPSLSFGRRTQMDADRQHEVTVLVEAAVADAVRRTARRCSDIAGQRSSLIPGGCVADEIADAICREFGVPRYGKL